jgi:hypothetical protein
VIVPIAPGPIGDGNAARRAVRHMRPGGNWMKDQERAARIEQNKEGLEMGIGRESEDPQNYGVKDDLQDLLGSVWKRRPLDPDLESDEDEYGHLPPDHPDADIYDDLDL